MDTTIESAEPTIKSFQVLNLGGDKLWKLVQSIDQCSFGKNNNLKEVSPSADENKKYFDYLLQKEKEVWNELVRLTIAKFISNVLHESGFNEHVIMLLRANLANCDFRRPEKIVSTLKQFRDTYNYSKDLAKDIDDLLKIKDIHDCMVIRNTLEKSNSREELLKEKIYSKIKDEQKQVEFVCDDIE